MPPEKIKKSAEGFLPWGGWFAHPVLDSEVADRHPEYWKRQRRYVREAAEAGRDVDLTEFKRLGEEDKTASGTKYHIPEGISLPVLKSRFQSSIAPDEALRRLRGLVNGDFVLARCTAFSDGRELLRHQPPQGLFAYIWLHVLCRKGAIPSVPVTALHELEDGIHDLLGEWLAIGDNAAPVLLWLDALAAGLAHQVA